VFYLLLPLVVHLSVIMRWVADFDGLPLRRGDAGDVVVRLAAASFSLVHAASIATADAQNDEDNEKETRKADADNCC
jgi:hypothetical protein